MASIILEPGTASWQPEPWGGAVLGVEVGSPSPDTIYQVISPAWARMARIHPAIVLVRDPAEGEATSPAISVSRLTQDITQFQLDAGDSVLGARAIIVQQTPVWIRLCPQQLLAFRLSNADTAELLPTTFSIEWVPEDYRGPW